MHFNRDAALAFEIHRVEQLCFHLALRDVQRSGRPRQYATEAEARVAALACSQAPQGSTRWTVRLLHEVAQAEPGLHPISRETVRRLLKKTASSRGEN